MTMNRTSLIMSDGPDVNIQDFWRWQSVIDRIEKCWKYIFNLIGSPFILLGYCSWFLFYLAQEIEIQLSKSPGEDNKGWIFSECYDQLRMAEVESSKSHLLLPPEILHQIFQVVQYEEYKFQILLVKNKILKTQISDVWLCV